MLCRPYASDFGNKSDTGQSCLSKPVAQPPGNGPSQDFLYYAPHLNDQQIKARYNDLILDKYSNANKELQTLLGKQ